MSVKHPGCLALRMTAPPSLHTLVYTLSTLHILPYTHILSQETLIHVMRVVCCKSQSICKPCQMEGRFCQFKIRAIPFEILGGRLETKKINVLRVFAKKITVRFRIPPNMVLVSLSSILFLEDHWISAFYTLSLKWFNIFSTVALVFAAPNSMHFPAVSIQPQFTKYSTQSHWGPQDEVNQPLRNKTISFILIVRKHEILTSRDFTELFVTFFQLEPALCIRR